MAQRLTSYKYLYEQLQKARLSDRAVTEQIQQGETIHPYKAGKAIANAYEQLRNAAELADGNITLQRAIKRFYRRTLFITHLKPERVGQELLTELIVSGYIQEGSVGEHAASIIADMVTKYADVFRDLRNSGISQKQAKRWTLAVLSVQTYNMLSPHTQDLLIAGFSYQYFHDELPRDAFIERDGEQDMYSDALYVAAHQALLQSGIDVVRTDLLFTHGLDGSDIQEYIRWNMYADELYTSPLTLRLRRAISRNGAPFRVLRSLIVSNPPDEILLNRELFMQAYTQQIHKEYAKLNKRLNSGILKSITFLFLTKVTIGFAIEVPFDLYMYGSVAILPLTINILFPPLYMASIRLGLTTPSVASAEMTTEFMDSLLYGDNAPRPRLPKNSSRRAGARLAYGLLFFVPFILTYYVLSLIGFNLLQMGIFIVFFSTASFLGWRLSHMVQELRMVNSESGLFSILRDLFYLPFILVGQWLAGRYAQVNVIGEVLDLIIELPLKTVLSLVRQWVHFLHEKHEELY